MSDAILQLCALSMVCGAVLTLLPEGACKQVLRILCSAALISTILSPAMGFDFEQFALESAKLHEIEAAFFDDATETEARLNRLVIEQRYEEYILDKALELGIDKPDVVMTTQWNEAGLWVPNSCEINGSWDSAQMLQLQRLIKDELGIPEERQHWKHE